jgi:hypothetical protein
MKRRRGRVTVMRAVKREPQLLMSPQHNPKLPRRPLTLRVRRRELVFVHRRLCARDDVDEPEGVALLLQQQPAAEHLRRTHAAGRRMGVRGRELNRGA